MNNLLCFYLANGNGNAHHRNSLPTSDQFSMPIMPNSPGNNMMMMTQNNKTAAYNTATLSHLTGLEGIPFVLRDDLRPSAGVTMVVNKAMNMIAKYLNYLFSFSTESTSTTTV